MTDQLFDHAPYTRLPEKYVRIGKRGVARARAALAEAKARNPWR